MIISMIAARDKNGVIGVKNDLPWHIPEEFKYFKTTTMGKTIIMGRKTFESLSGHPLPKRFNIVVTRTPEKFESTDKVLFVKSLEKALEVAHDRCAHEDDEVFIIGGQQIYTQGLEFADKIYITEVDLEVENGEAFFPTFNETAWDEIKNEPANNDTYRWTYRVLKRKL